MQRLNDFLRPCDLYFMIHTIILRLFGSTTVQQVLIVMQSASGITMQFASWYNIHAHDTC
jgi:hypothetical protein